LFSQTSRFDFIGNRRKAYVLSALLLLLGMVSLVVKGGPRYGIDFVGGMVVQAKSAVKVDARTVEQALAPAGLAGVVVQEFGAASDNEILIRVATAEEEAAAARTAITEALAQIPEAHFEIQRVDMVGAKVSSDLRTQALEALFYAVLLISIYISGRFEQKWMIAALMAACLGAAVYGLGLLDVSKEVLILGALAVTLVVCWKLKLFYALGAIVALIHDTLITVGVFSLLDKEIDLSIVAAAHHHRLLPQRHHHRVRPHPREPARQDIAAPARNHQCRHQPDLVAYGAHFRYDLAGDGEPVRPRRRGDPRLCVRPFGGYRRGDVFVHLRGSAHPLGVRAGSPARGRAGCGAGQGGVSSQRCVLALVASWCLEQSISAACPR